MSSRLSAMSTTRAAIAPVDLRDFLQSEGWTPLELALADGLYVLNNARFPQRQLIFPIDRAASDYEESVELVIDKFSQLSGQPPSALFSTIASLREDVIRLRVSSGDNDDALPLKFASTFIKNTQKLLKTAACAAVSPHLHHPRLSINEATAFIENARFGQTERGSFILHVSCPLNGMDKPKKTALTNDDMPFVRKVTLNLHAALSDLVSNIERDTLSHFIDDLKDASAPSISANMCEALSAMHDDQLNNALTIRFDWSALRKVASGKARQSIDIPRDYFPRIEEIRQALRTIERDDSEASYIGTVEQLNGTMDRDGRRSGDVMLSLLMRDTGQAVRVSLYLSAEDYAKAHQAHINRGSYVRVTGRLKPGKQPRPFVDLAQFVVLPR